MKRILLIAFVLLLSISMFGCTSAGTEAQNKEEQQKQVQQNEDADKNAVKNAVEEFGKKLQMVSLLAPKDVLSKSMQENYSDFVSQGLIEKWISDPQNAPGRLTSSPWPDRIEISTVEKTADKEYTVKGEVIEVTSAEQESGEAAAKRPITLIVREIEDKWLIDDVTLGAYE